jgi:hypothetical protein
MKTRAAATAILAVLAAGCGSTHHTATPTPTLRSTTTRTDPQATLTRAVRAALHANHQLARLVLWRNVVPRSASQSTRGPALAALRSSVVGRRRRGVHVKVVDDGFAIQSVQLDPSYTRASAITVDPQRVQPYGNDGKPLGQPVKLVEKSRFELHRLGSSQRFVVWQVTPAR